VTLVAALVPLAAGIFWKRANNLGALASCVCGLAGWLAAAFFAPDATVPPPLVGLALHNGHGLGALVPAGHAVATHTITAARTDGRDAAGASAFARIAFARLHLLIVYASLYPLEGWRDHGISPFAS